MENHRHWMRGWLWELLALTGSIIATALMIILLAIYNGRTVFLLHGVTLNAIIAVLSTLSKTTLLFALTAAIGEWKWIKFSENSTRIIDAYIIDEASRGPLGSMWLAWRTKAMINVLNLGAFCTILSLAIDPFTQQLIDYKQHIVYQDNFNTTIPRAQRFSKGTLNRVQAVKADVTDLGQLNALSNSFSYTKASADSVIQSAIQYGIIQPKNLVTQQLPFSCTTGNCTFDSFQSLAVCSQCFDVSSYVTISTEADTQPLGYLLDENNGGSIVADVSTMSLPTGLFISNTVEGAAYYLIMTTLGTVNASKTILFQDVDTLIWSSSILRIKPAALKTQSNWPNVPIDALECGLYYCVNNYLSSVQSGTLVETITTNASAKRLPDSWQATPRDFVNVPNTDSIEYQNLLSYSDRTDLSLGDGFNISQAAVASISAYVQNVFAANLSQDGVNGFFMNIPDGDDEQFSPDSTKALVKSLDLNQTFQNLAQSLTNAIRDGSDNSTLETGRLGHAEIRYSIRWPWISLHGLVVLMGTLCLLLTMIKAAGSRVPRWKSHLLPCLLWGSHINGGLPGSATTTELEKKAWKQRARLYYYEGSGPDDAFTPVPSSYELSRTDYSDANKPLSTPSGAFGQMTPEYNRSGYFDDNRPLHRAAEVLGYSYPHT